MCGSDAETASKISVENTPETRFTKSVLRSKQIGSAYYFRQESVLLLSVMAAKTSN